MLKGTTHEGAAKNCLREKKTASQLGKCFDVGKHDVRIGIRTPFNAEHLIQTGNLGSEYHTNSIYQIQLHLCPKICDHFLWDSKKYYI